MLAGDAGPLPTPDALAVATMSLSTLSRAIVQGQVRSVRCSFVKASWNDLRIWPGMRSACSSLTNTWRLWRVKVLRTSEKRGACTCVCEELVVAAMDGRLGGMTCVGEEIIVVAAVV